jgi:hypothetical protein
MTLSLSVGHGLADRDAIILPVRTGSAVEQFQVEP